MKRDLENVVADIKNSRGPQLLLLFGDDLQVQGACKTLLTIWFRKISGDLISNASTVDRRRGTKSKLH